MSKDDYITEAEALSDNLETYIFPYDRDIYFITLWEELKSKGYVWEDRYGNYYKAKALRKDKRRLKNIISYAKRNGRPMEQIKALENLLFEVQDA